MRCESALQEAGFRRAEIVATLAGEPLYLAFGYAIDGRLHLPLENGLNIEAAGMSKDF